MIVYNVTVKVDRRIAAQWLKWLRQTEAPAVLATGCFDRYHLLRLLDVDDEEGPTYAVQYHAPTYADYQEYLDRFAAGFQRRSSERWGSRCVSFGTAMEQLA